MSDESPTLSIQGSGDAPNIAANTESVEAPLTEGTSEASLDAETGQQQSYYDGKYGTIQDLESAHKELEQKLGNRSAEMAQRDIDAIIEKAGVDNESMIHNWQADGQLSDDEYGKLAKLGYGRTVVDTFLHGQHAIASHSQEAQFAIQNNANQIAGGEVELNNLLAWAGQNYSEGRVDRFNERLASPTEYEGALKEVLYDYKQAVGGGFTSPLVTGQVMPNTSSGFSTTQELVEAIRDARNSGSMPEQVKRRIANTPKHIIQGVDGR